MIKDQHIIYFGPEKWDGMWRNRHQLMTRFAKYNKVLYVEPKYYLKDLRHKLFRGGEGFSLLVQNAKQKRIIKKAEHLNLYIYNTPLFFPVSTRSIIGKFTMDAWILYLKTAIKQMGFRNPIIWLSRPNMIDLIGKFNEKMTIYHVVDEYLGYGIHSEESKQTLVKMEHEMLRRVDLVITVSENLFLSKHKLNKHTYLVPNAVDYDSYDIALRSNFSPPDDISDLPKPIIGYSGLISTRLDFRILDHIAFKHPEWSVVLMGGLNKGCEGIMKRFQKFKNIHLLGVKKIDEVPQYVKLFDVCIIPYGKNKQSENLSPLKLYDYFAMGKPVVTTDFPVARNFRDVIKISNSKEEFLKSIEKILLGENKQLFLNRRKIAFKNTWDHRIEELSEILKSHHTFPIKNK